MTTGHSILALITAVAAQGAFAAGAAHHPHSPLFIGRFSPRALVPPGSGDASGTGAFVLTSDDNRRFRLSYDLTYASLRSPDVRRVALANFGAGGNGKVVHVICGEGAAACAKGIGRTLSGNWGDNSQPPLTPELVSELTAQRIYAEVATDRGPELRAQLEGQPLMAAYTQYIGRISADSPQGPVSGTAAGWLVAVPDKSMALIDATVAAGNAKLRSARLGNVTLLKPAQSRTASVSARVDPRQIKSLSAADLDRPVLALTLGTQPPVEIRAPLEVVP